MKINEMSKMQTTKHNSNYALRQIVVLLRLHVILTVDVLCTRALYSVQCTLYSMPCIQRILSMHRARLCCSHCPCPLFVFMYNFLDTVRAWSPLFPIFAHAFALLISNIKHLSFLPVQMAHHRQTTIHTIKSNYQQTRASFSLAYRVRLSLSLSQCFVHLSFIVDYLFLLHCGSFNFGCIAFFILLYVYSVFGLLLLSLLLCYFGCLFLIRFN